jgi:hypothetical protein
MKATRPSVANEGRICITHPEHGPSLIQHKTGREWCPHQTHDGPTMSKGKRKGKATTPWLDKQVIEDDTADRPQSA